MSFLFHLLTVKKKTHLILQKKNFVPLLFLFVFILQKFVSKKIFFSITEYFHQWFDSNTKKELNATETFSWSILKCCNFSSFTPSKNKNNFQIPDTLIISSKNKKRNIQKNCFCNIFCCHCFSIPYLTSSLLTYHFHFSVFLVKAFISDNVFRSTN